MSAKDLAKVVWRWGALARQVAADYRFHKQVRGLPTPFLRRFIEQARLLWSNRIRAVDYYNLGLFDPTLPAASKRSYIGGFQSWRLLFLINSEKFHHLTDKKLLFNGYAAEAKLPVSEILAVVTNEPRSDAIPRLGSEAELSAWMTENAIADIVCKPVDGVGGWGMLSLGNRIAEQARWISLPGGEAIDTPTIWAHCARYLYRGGVIIERRLRPHPILAKLMPNVLHTVRVITYLEPQPVIVDAVLRLGSGNGPVDNFSRGGIAVPIDVATGQCGQGTMLVDGLPQFVDEHPVTGRRITGVILPDWDEVCDLAKTAARRFDVQKSIGWDIGLTTDGPIFLEGNWCYGLRINQLARRKGILDTLWIEVFNHEGAYRCLGLGFFNRPRV